MTNTTVFLTMHNIVINTHIYDAIYYPLLEELAVMDNTDVEGVEKKAEKLGLKKNENDMFDTRELCEKLDQLDLYYRKIEDFLEETPILMDGALEMIKGLRDDEIKIILVTNSERQTLMTYLLKYDLLKHVETCYCGEEVGFKRSDPQFWKALLETEKLEAKNCLAVVTKDAEQKAAEDIGMHTFVVRGDTDIDRILAKAQTV